LGFVEKSQVVETGGDIRMLISQQALPQYGSVKPKIR
jgi:hypothetical protein